MLLVKRTAQRLLCNAAASSAPPTIQHATHQLLSSPNVGETAFLSSVVAHRAREFRQSQTLPHSLTSHREFALEVANFVAAAAVSGGCSPGLLLETQRLLLSSPDFTAPADGRSPRQSLPRGACVPELDAALARFVVAASTPHGGVLALDPRLLTKIAGFANPSLLALLPTPTLVGLAAALIASAHQLSNVTVFGRILREASLRCASTSGLGDTTRCDDTVTASSLTPVTQSEGATDTSASLLRRPLSLDEHAVLIYSAVAAGATGGTARLELARALEHCTSLLRLVAPPWLERQLHALDADKRAPALQWQQAATSAAAAAASQADTDPNAAWSLLETAMTEFPLSLEAGGAQPPPSSTSLSPPPQQRATLQAVRRAFGARWVTPVLLLRSMAAIRQRDKDGKDGGGGSRLSVAGSVFLRRAASLFLTDEAARASAQLERAAGNPLPPHLRTSPRGRGGGPPFYDAGLALLPGFFLGATLDGCSSSGSAPIEVLRTALLTAFGRVCRTHGYPPPELCRPTSQGCVLHAAWPEQQLAIMIDHPLWHTAALEPAVGPVTVAALAHSVEVGGGPVAVAASGRGPVKADASIQGDLFLRSEEERVAVAAARASAARLGIPFHPPITDVLRYRAYSATRGPPTPTALLAEVTARHAGYRLFTLWVRDYLHLLPLVEGGASSAALEAGVDAAVLRCVRGMAEAVAPRAADVVIMKKKRVAAAGAV